MKIQNLALTSMLLALTATACSKPSEASKISAKPESSQDDSAQQSLLEESPKQTDVMVQLFNYPFKNITSEMKTLADIGYAQIHVSPPNLTIDSDQWWGRYQPVDYRVIAGPLGSEKDFREMIKTAHANGIKIIVDIVFNHTNNPVSPLPKEAVDLLAKAGPLFTDADYHENSCISNYNDVWQVRNLRMCGGGADQGLPDLSQDSAHVLKVQQDFLKRLNSMGVDGFRLDAIKHMEPAYFSKLLTPDITKGKFIFGEIIADQASFDRDLAPYLSATDMSLYDFPLRDTLQKSLGFGGSLKTLADTTLVDSERALPWNRAVTFVMNHDIPNNAGFRSWIPNETDEELSYAYLLGRAEGVPYVYSDLGTKGGAGLIDDRWDHAHRKFSTAQGVKFHNHVFGEGQNVLYADDCLLVVQRGTKGVFGINKCDEERNFNLHYIWPNGEKVVELITKAELGAYQDLELPGRSARFVVATKTK
ncbi:MAG: alpha-amylase [Proteobacteria bacterium]|nr:MAG: alpha-amylase [Pseudomonadota bacterium]